MKVLLVRCRETENLNTRLPDSLNKAQGIYPPLGIAYIAAFLEQHDIDVEILDILALNLTREEIKNAIRRINPEIIGLTSMTPTCRSVIDVCYIAKEVNSDILTVVGGVHMSIFAREMLSFPCIDVGVIGDGEDAMLKICKDMHQGKRPKGVLKGERIDNLDILPIPARHLLPNDKYWCVIVEKPFTTMITTRGCPFGCGFCYPAEKKVRFRDPIKVVDEMELIARQYKFKEILFYDDTFTLSRKHAINICEEIIRRGLKLKWEAPTRCDRVDRKLLEIMKKAGCIRLRFGVESGDQNILNHMNKGITLEQIRQAFKLTKKAGIETFAYFIIGYMGEDENTIKSTIRFAKELSPDWVMFTAATPLPETMLYEESVKAGLVDKNYWSDFTLGKRNDRLPFLIENADLWAKQAYKEFYLRPSFMIHKLKSINSLYRLKHIMTGAYAILKFRMN
ncbi:MAG: B12-binding domain-containing radical SAM protein [Nanoarchaeota archaeon]|nr:B12-binding domain-containing radical SAM protein [Nanoarchaeota archaeon]